MSILMGFEALRAATTTSTNFNFSGELSTSFTIIPTISSSSVTLPSNRSHSSKPRKVPRRTVRSFGGNTIVSALTNKVRASRVAAAEVEEQVEVEICEGYTMTQFCDKIIDLFLNEKPKSKEWRKYLVFREEWKKYRDSFYSRCLSRSDSETDPQMKQKLSSLSRRVKKIDDEMDRHSELLKEVQDNPTDINAIVARRRKDFTEEFFCYLNILSETYDSLEDRDAVARLGARCLSAVSAFDNTLEIVDTLDTAQAKFDDILNSPSVDVACEKIKV
ncbi:hypothetical protein NMG60_11006085 [Bertholletia excelsa]